MNSSLLHSPYWYRVAELHPRLTRNVSVHRQALRRGVSYVLRDGASGKMMRLNESAYELAGRMDGVTKLADIWKSVCEKEGDHAPTQGETISVLASLVDRGLVRCETTPEGLDVLEREIESKRKTRRASFNLLSLRIPLGNPTALLDRAAQHVPPVPATAITLLWFVLAALALFALADKGSELAAHARQLTGSPHSLALLCVMYPVVKALHELAHAVALRTWGGGVREMGITLMMGMPVPYVDASDADTFPERHRRVLVSAAGILVELALAALAAMLWVALEPGLLRDTALTVFLIGTVSTLLFNGNPLMRMDGYHMLADAVGMPNLAARAKALLREKIAGWFTGVRASADESEAHDETPAERRWLIAYALASGAYRVVISVTLTLWAASLSTLLGVALGLMMLTALVIKPATEAVRFLSSSPNLSRRRSRHVARAFGITTVLLAVICFVPLPMRVSAPGVVWVPPEAETRAAEEGFVQRVLVADGDNVQPGQALMVLNEPKLIAQHEKAVQRLSALDTEFHSIVLSQPSRAQAIERNMQGARAELEQLAQRQQALVVRSGAAGKVSLKHTADWPDRFVKKGQVVSHVFGDDLMLVRTVVEQGDVELIRSSLRHADVRLADMPGTQWQAELVRETPAATRKLPNAVLGELGGGSIAVDATDTQGVTALRPVHVLDLKLPKANLEALGGRVGTRAYVHFDLPAQPLFAQGMRVVRQLFLRHFARET